MSVFSEGTRLSGALTAVWTLHLNLRAPTCETVESENGVCFLGLEAGPGCMVVDGTRGAVPTYEAGAKECRCAAQIFWKTVLETGVGRHGDSSSPSWPLPFLPQLLPLMLDALTAVT